MFVASGLQFLEVRAIRTSYELQVLVKLPVLSDFSFLVMEIQRCCGGENYVIHVKFYHGT